MRQSRRSAEQISNRLHYCSCQATRRGGGATQRLRGGETSSQIYAASMNPKPKEPLIYSAYRG
jgi:hypothetical protein